MSDEKKKAIRPKAQAFSDALTHLRYVGLELKEAAIEAQNAMFALQNDMMDDPGSKMMAMDTGEIESRLIGYMAVHGDIKHTHKLASDIGKKLGEPMPKAPNYPDEWLELASSAPPLTLSSTMRR
jgi:hypothetical protein